MNIDYLIETGERVYAPEVFVHGVTTFVT